MIPFFPHPRQTGCYAWHGTKAVTLTWDAPLFKASGPGLSVSKIEPLGVVSLSWFCLSSSRSLGHSLLLGQRSRMNLFSHFIGSLFHQHYGNPDTEFSCYRYNRDSGGYVSRMPAANRTKEFPELSVLADCRPGSLDEFASQPWVSAMGDRSSISSLAGGVLSGNQTQKPCQLTDVLKLSPVADAGQKLASRNPTIQECSSGISCSPTTPDLPYRSGGSPECS
jgi:hypothetical protein